jgi:hypothetical protein
MINKTITCSAFFFKIMYCLYFKTLKMSLPSQRADFSLELAPHTLTTNAFNAQGSISDLHLPPASTPVVFDSVKYPAVDGQFLQYYQTPRVQTGASGCMGIFGGYRQTQSFDEGQSPVNNPFFFKTYHQTLTFYKQGTDNRYSSSWISISSSSAFGILWMSR